MPRQANYDDCPNGPADEAQYFAYLVKRVDENQNELAGLNCAAIMDYVDTWRWRRRHPDKEDEIFLVHVDVYAYATLVAAQQGISRRRC